MNIMNINQKTAQVHTSESGFMMSESMGSLLFYLIMIASTAALIVALLMGGKLSEMQQGVSTIRMQTQQLFTGSIDYTGFNNDLAIKSGIVPKRFRRGGNLFTPWGGAITLATGADVGTFTITLESIGQEDCAKMGTYQMDSWDSVSINGNALDKNSFVVTAGAACTTTNTIIYTSR